MTVLPNTKIYCRLVNIIIYPGKCVHRVLTQSWVCNELYTNLLSNKSRCYFISVGCIDKAIQILIH